MTKTIGPISRKRGETIRIGRDIVIIVRELHGNRVGLEVQHPEELEVKRGECAEHELEERAVVDEIERTRNQPCEEQK